MYLNTINWTSKKTKMDVFFVIVLRKWLSQVRGLGNPTRADKNRAWQLLELDQQSFSGQHTLPYPG